MKNIEKLDKVHLAELRNNLKKGIYAIPSFQREFEWGANDVNGLIRSIFEDYYVGTLLLWRATKTNQSFLKCEPIYGYKDEPKYEHIVLDGQQRLSALYYAFFAPDMNFPRRKSRYLFFIDLEKLLDGNNEDAFIYDYGRSANSLISDEEKQFSRKLFPLKVIGDGDIALYKWLENYQKYWTKDDAEKAKSEKDALEKIFLELINEYYISYIELDRDIEVSKVCDIFTRINNTGVSLDIFDLLNALLTPKDINLKELWRQSSEKFSTELGKAKIYILQTMSLLKQEYCAPKYLYFLVPGVKKKTREKSGKFKDVILVDSKENFDELWEQSLEKNLLALRIIMDPKKYGAVNSRLIPYPTMIPILAALTIEKEKKEYVDKKSIDEKINAWYWSSIFTGNYSGSVETQMSQDLREIRKWFLDDSKVPLVIKKFKRVLDTPDFLKKLSPGSAIYKGVLCLLAKKEARDFISWELPEYLELDDHHMVPHSWGMKKSINAVDSIFNRTLISDDTNRKIIRDKLPNVYIKEMADRNLKGMDDVYELFESHMVPKEAVDILLRPSFGESDFYEYLEIREIAIKKELSKIIDKINIDTSNIDADYEDDTMDDESGIDYEVDPSILLICKSSKSSAKAHSCGGNGVKVLEGSKITPTIAKSFEAHNYNTERNRLIENGTIKEVDGDLVFTKDHEFSSPSAAAAVILGHSANGGVEWKTEDGVELHTLKEESKID